jgi:hypothetical protein
MITFDPDARRARINCPGEAPIDGQLVCYYPCPRCSNPARALVYLGDAALASEVVAQDEDVARHLGLLAVGAGLALNGGHAGYGGRECRLSLWTEAPAALAHTVWEVVHQAVHQETPDLPTDATCITSLPEIYVVGDIVGRETVPVVLYRRWSSPSELAERVAGGPWDTRGESYEAYQRRRERAPDALLAMLKGAE